MFLNDILFFIIGIISAFVGSVSGGAGLVAMPLLLALGLPTQIALGSYNFGDIGFKIGNIIKFAQIKNLGIKRRDVIILTLIAVPATAIGASLVVSINPEILNKLIGVILLIIIPLLFINKNLGIKEDRAVGRKRVVSHIAFFFARVWAGFFSPGSGITETYIKMRGYGYTILQGKAVTRIPHILATIGSVIIFIKSDFVNFRVAIILFLGMVIGGYMGTSYAVKKGDAFLKPLLGIVILITAVKMLFF